jgi:hypothetical protein
MTELRSVVRLARIKGVYRAVLIKLIFVIGVENWSSNLHAPILTKDN